MTLPVPLLGLLVVMADAVVRQMTPMVADTLVVARGIAPLAHCGWQRGILLVASCLRKRQSDITLVTNALGLCRRP